MPSVYCKLCRKKIARVSEIRNCARCGQRSAIPATVSDDDWLTPSLIANMGSSDFTSLSSFSGGGGESGGAGAGSSWDSGSSSGSYDSGSSSSDSGPSGGGSSGGGD